MRWDGVLTDRRKGGDKSLFQTTIVIGLWVEIGRGREESGRD